MKAESPGKDPDKIDEVYVQACLESRDSLKTYGLDMDKIEAEARQGAHIGKKAPKRRLWLRLLLIAVFAFLLFNVFMFALDFPWAKSYQFELRKYVSRLAGISSSSQDMLTLCSSADISEAQKSVPFDLPVPHWLPDGYTLYNARVDTDTSGNYSIYQKYQSMDDQIIIFVSNNTLYSESLPSEKEAGYEKLEIDTLQVYAQLQLDNLSQTSCHLYTEKGLYIFVSGRLDKQSLTQLIKSLD